MKLNYAWQSFQSWMEIHRSNFVDDPENRPPANAETCTQIHDIFLLFVFFWLLLVRFDLPGWLWFPDCFITHSIEWKILINSHITNTESGIYVQMCSRPEIAFGYQREDFHLKQYLSWFWVWNFVPAYKMNMILCGMLAASSFVSYRIKCTKCIDRCCRCQAMPNARSSHSAPTTNHTQHIIL